MATFHEEKSSLRIDTLRRKEEEEVTKLLAKRYQLPYIDLFQFPIEVGAIKTVPEESARSAELAVVQTTGKRITVALHNPEKQEAKNALRHLEEDGYTSDLYIASKSSLLHAWEFYKKAPEKKITEAGTLEINHERIADLQTKFTTIQEVKERITSTSATRTSEALEMLLAGALAVEASDVHIEPQQNDVRIRFRLDGVLYDILAIPERLYHLLLSRIKLVSELKLNLHGRAQDGRFTIKTKIVDIEIRTSTLPGPKGENVVLRILNPKSIQVPFDQLGMQPWITAIMAKELDRPNGMILTTGPTGSGKTTTLYTFLRKIHSPEIKIITIEDPIEYHLAGMEQTQIDAEKGYDFANGLRSIVRQDPDVILVGEIRDFETAEIAMHAALTGHLVFSTLHTNDAAGTVPRLIDLGVKPPIIAPAMNISMAQRLVRKLCEQCRLSAEIKDEERTAFKKELAAFPQSAPVPDEHEWRIFKIKEGGCSSCHFTGYKGRVGVFEVILIDEGIERLILEQPSEYQIKKEAARQGQISMRQDGILKVLAGMTDFEEIQRVLGV